MNEIETNNLAEAEQGLMPYLLSRKLISEDQLRIIDYEVNKSKESVAQTLIRLGFISEAALKEALSETSGQQSVDLALISFDGEALEKVPRELANRFQLLPLSWDEDKKELTIAATDANDLLAQDKLAQILPPQSNIIIKLASASEINKAIDEAYGYKLNIDSILQEIETGNINIAELENDKSYSQPTVRLVTAIITDAVKREASDIHFEPEADFLRIRYRIDGVLRQIRVLHKSYWSAMVVRIKVIARLNIAETRAPQDGRLSMTVRGNPIDFRVSILPTIHGENIVMRILDRKSRELSLENLGASETQIALINRLISRPEGIIVATGPTGSGKTTTLYAMLSKINTEGVNIMTLEDPVEFPINMLRQTSIAETVKIDYADGIRSMMRQDPDVILVGEIRDSETAQMSFRAAMTGHQVYTTLHTNSAFGVFPRLRDMQVSTEVLYGNVIGIIAQRLIRKLCPHCKVVTEIPRQLKSYINSDKIFQAVGCNKCDFTGYHSREAIFEILVVDEELDYAISIDKNPKELKEIAYKNGFIPLSIAGLERVAAGVTTIAEISRNTDLTHFYHQ